jgi:hypothetical protein
MVCKDFGKNVIPDECFDMKVSWKARGGGAWKR